MATLTKSQAAALTADERLDYLTKTVLGEAGGEGYAGMIAVANVINNRSMDWRYPSDPVAVAGQPWQFSTHNSASNGGNQANVERWYPPTSETYRMAQAAVRAAIIDRTAPDITGGAEFYHSVAMGYPSSWGTGIQQYGFIDINGQRFYPSHPVPPDSIPNAVASLVYNDTAVLSELSVRTSVFPATMSSNVQLQRELNRTAAAKAVAEVRKTSPAFLDTARADPNAITWAPRATGTVTSTKQTFELDHPHLTPAAYAATLPDMAQVKAPAVVAAPWGVRQAVASAAASAQIGDGKSQMLMAGNPNIAGSVTSWLYPEPTPQANQDGKTDRVRPAPDAQPQAAAETQPAVIPPSRPPSPTPAPAAPTPRAGPALFKAGVGDVPGMVSRGNIDLNARQVLREPDGTIKTEESISIGTDLGGEVLIPTVVDGKKLTDDQAIRHYEDTGQHLGVFYSPQAADAYAQKLHVRQGYTYAPKEPGPASANVRDPRPSDPIAAPEKSPVGQPPATRKVQTIKVTATPKPSPAEQPIVNVTPQGHVRVGPPIKPSSDAIIAGSINAADGARDPAMAVAIDAKLASENTKTVLGSAAAASAATSPVVANALSAQIASRRSALEARKDGDQSVPIAAPTQPARTMLPPIAPQRATPIGTAPNFKELSALSFNPLDPLNSRIDTVNIDLPHQRPQTHVTPNAPQPAPVDDAAKARAKAPLPSQSIVKKQAPVPQARPTTAAPVAQPQVNAPASPAKPAPAPVAPARGTIPAPAPAKSTPSTQDILDVTDIINGRSTSNQQRSGSTSW